MCRWRRPSTRRSNRSARRPKPKNVALAQGDRSGSARRARRSRRLQQIIWNLLSNAVRFTPAGGHVEVTVRSAAEPGFLEIVVADTGCGIDAGFLPHVFERFRQGDSSTTRTHGGLGLGLAIVRDLVGMHGGTVHAESAGDGQGTTFTVRLPAAAPREMADAPAPVAAAPAGAELTGANVLVVDDDPDAREVLRTILEDAGAAVTTSASARETRELLARPAPRSADRRHRHARGGRLFADSSRSGIRKRRVARSGDRADRTYAARKTWSMRWRRASRSTSPSQSTRRGSSIPSRRCSAALLIAPTSPCTRHGLALRRPCYHRRRRSLQRSAARERAMAPTHRHAARFSSSSVWSASASRSPMCRLGAAGARAERDARAVHRLSPTYNPVPSAARTARSTSGPSTARSRRRISSSPRSTTAIPTSILATFRLKVTGLVNKSLSLSLDDLKKMGSNELVAGFECSGNSARDRRSGRQRQVDGRAAEDGARSRRACKAEAREFVFFGADHGTEEVEWRTQKFTVEQQFGRSLHARTCAVGPIRFWPGR